jgi:hypothetical protein
MIKKLLMKASGHGGSNPVRANPGLPITDRVQAHGPPPVGTGGPLVGASNDPEVGIPVQLIAPELGFESAPRSVRRLGNSPGRINAIWPSPGITWADHKPVEQVADRGDRCLAVGADRAVGELLDIASDVHRLLAGGGEGRGGLSSAEGAIPT